MLTEVNAAAVRWSNVQLPGEISLPKRGEKSAEAIVIELKRVGGRRNVRLNNETRGATTQRRAEPMRISVDLMEGNYRPAPVRRVFIPKPDGSKRPLGVSTVLDRVIQQAIAQVISPLFEAGFSPKSHGFRPNRSAYQAVETMEAGWKEGRRHAVD